MEKELKNYLHLYPEVYVRFNDEKHKVKTYGEFDKAFITGLFQNPAGAGLMAHLCVDDWEDPVEVLVSEIRPILRPLSDMTDKDFNEFAKSVLHREGEVMVYAEVNRQWCAASIDIENCYELEDIERTSAKEMICNAEEADYDNVLSCDKGKSIAYGANDEMRYFVDVEVQAQFVRYLLSKHFDLFGLIPAGLAIDSTTLKPTRQ